MRSVQLHHPNSLHLGLFVIAYVLGCGFAQLLAVVPGTGISIWPPSGLFIATLVLAPRPSWPWWVLAGLVAELLGNVLWFHNPLPLALLIYTGNALEAVVGAWLVNRFGRPARLETLQEVLALVVLGSGIAPIISATVGSATLAWLGIQPFATAWPLWWIGDATGVLIVAPLVLVVLQNWRGRLTAAQWMEAGVLGLILLGVAALSLSGYLPFAYIIMPPLLWAAVRFEFRGAAVALTLLALITVVFTLSGTSQFIGDPESQKHKQIMLQLFLAISAFSALVVAAISRQHQMAVSTLRQSQRQLQQMINALPVRVWSATPAGEPLYFNKRYHDHFRAVIPDFDSIPSSGIKGLVQELAHPDDKLNVQQTLQSCFETGNASVMRFRWREKDGEYRWAECRVEPRRDESGAIAEWYGVSVDIDEEVRAQEALRERERELSQLVDMVPVQIRRLTPEGNPIFFNKRLLDFFGLNDVAQLDKPDMTRLAAAITALVHPEDSPRLLETARRSFVTGEPFSLKYRMRRADGAYRWVDGRGEPIRDQNGTIVQWYAISIDIEDEMRLYRDLAEREARIRRLVDSDIIGIVFWDLDGTLVDANDAFLRMVQYDREDLKAGLDWLAMTPLEWREVHAREEAAELAATGRMRPREKEFFRKDGTRLPVLIGAACFEGQSRQGVAYILDLTERKRAEAAQTRVEEALRRSELQLQQLVDTVPVQIWCVSPGGEPAYINKTMMDYIGLNLKDFEAKGGGLPSAIQTLVHPDDKAALLEALTHSFSTGEPFALKFRNRRADGTYRWQEGRAEPLRDESGRIIRWFGANVDIEDFVAAQEALRESERELAQLIDMLPVYIRRLTPQGEPIYFNKRLTDFIGVSLADIGKGGTSRLGPAVDNFIHPDEAAKVMAALRHAVATGEEYTMRYRMRGAEGVYRWIETRAEPLRNQDGTIVQWYSMSIDIEDQVRALQVEEELRQASDELAKATQAASLAELSASIAHEVNQPLAAIVANSHACQRWLTAEPPNLDRAQKTVERIIRDAHAAADVVSRIRALFKQSVETRTSTTLDGVIIEARNLIAEEAARRRVRIDLDVQGDLPVIALDRIQIQQVLVNLMRNGMEAMDAVMGERSLRICARRVGDLVQIEVSDRGPGVEFPDRMFEPFFSTKEQGMGMGLAISRSIVESHGGRLWVEKNEPQGATFIFTLPVGMKAAA